MDFALHLCIHKTSQIMPQHLLTPGPVPVPAFIQEAINQPVIYHRSKAFERFFAEMRQGLQYLFQTQYETLAMIGSGTYGMEALIYSLFQKGDKVAVVSMGKFSQRWVEYANNQSLTTIEIQTEWGKSPTVADCLQVIDAHTQALILTHCETSTGALCAVEEIAFAVKQAYPQLLILVDGISSIGALPFYMDNWLVDGAVVASQKALRNPTGTVYFALSPAAISHLTPTVAADGFHLGNYLQSARQNSYPYSPPISLFYGVARSLLDIQTSTLPVIWNEVHHRSQFFKQKIQAKGGIIMGEKPADALTAFYFPDKDCQVLKQSWAAEGVIVSGGQDSWKGKILRVAHYQAWEAQVWEIMGLND